MLVQYRVGMKCGGDHVVQGHGCCCSARWISGLWKPGWTAFSESSAISDFGQDSCATSPLVGPCKPTTNIRNYSSPSMSIIVQTLPNCRTWPQQVLMSLLQLPQWVVVDLQLWSKWWKNGASWGLLLVKQRRTELAKWFFAINASPQGYWHHFRSLPILDRILYSSVHDIGNINPWKVQPQQSHTHRSDWWLMSPTTLHGISFGWFAVFLCCTWRLETEEWHQWQWQVGNCH